MLDSLRAFFVPPISADPGENTAKLAWLVRLRWLAIGAQALCIVPALELRVLERPMLPGFVSVMGLLALLNIATWAALRRGYATSQAQNFFQLAADVVGLSALLALTGGAWNPMLPILFVHLGMGALILEGRLSLMLFVLMLGCIAFNQAYAHIPTGLADRLLPAQLLFPAQYLVAGVFWILTSWLSRTLNSLQLHFIAANVRKTRIDRLRAVGALAAGLSHEFATPLNTAKLKLARLGRTQGLRDDLDLATAAEALDRCEDILRRMTGSQLEPEGLSFEAVDVAKLVSQVCESATVARRSGAGGRIHFARVGRGPRFALLPSIAFSHAILNLIDNARESTPDDESIDVVVSGRVGRVEVSVLDRGDGWPEVVRRHLGEPFITTKQEGVGLGLYYVHNLSEAVGADFSLEDRENGGAIARISLPALTLSSE